MLRITHSLQIGPYLKDLRLAARKTQVEVADEMGVNSSTNLCAYEHGRRMPDLTTILLILRACGKQLAIVDREPEREAFCDDGCADWDEHHQHDRRENPCGLRWHDHCEHGWR